MEIVDSFLLLVEVYIKFFQKIFIDLFVGGMREGQRERGRERADSFPSGKPNSGLDCTPLRS